MNGVSDQHERDGRRESKTRKYQAIARFHCAKATSRYGRVNILHQGKPNPENWRTPEVELSCASVGPGTVNPPESTANPSLAEHAALRPRPDRAPRASKLDPFKPRIAELMTRYPHITAQRVFESLSAEGFDGGYNTVKKYVRAARPKPKPPPSRTTTVYGPGEMAESDWSTWISSAAS